MLLGSLEKINLDSTMFAYFEHYRMQTATLELELCHLMNSLSKSSNHFLLATSITSCNAMLIGTIVHCKWAMFAFKLFASDSAKVGISFIYLALLALWNMHA